MANPLLFLVSISPFIVFLILLLIFRKSLLTSSFIALLVTILIAVFFWGFAITQLPQPFTKAFFVAFDIFLIILGAIFFLEAMKEIRVIENIVIYLEEISSDTRVKVILLAWFLENFIEGIAGFGTPVTIVAPLLLALGMPASRALIIALLGNSTSVVFGAAGTPIRIGFQGLGTFKIAENAALISLVGFLVPVFMLYTLIGKERNKKEFWEAVPFAIFAGLAFTLPSWLFVYLGQEFPSILGSVAGLGLTLLAIKTGFLMPKKETNLRKVEKRNPTLSIGRVVLPYALMVGILILGKFFPLNIGQINLFNPGLVFLFTGFIFLLNKKSVLISSAKVAGKGTMGPSLVILTMSFLVQIMIASGMIGTVANAFRNSFLALWAPVVGMFGAFLTGRTC